MSAVELRKKLIEKINKTDDERIFEEAFRLLEMESDAIEIYNLSDEQKSVVNEAREQIKKGQFLPDEQANNEIDEWLNK